MDVCLDVAVLVALRRVVSDDVRAIDPVGCLAEQERVGLDDEPIERGAGHRRLSRRRTGDGEHGEDERAHDGRNARVDGMPGQAA